MDNARKSKLINYLYQNKQVVEFMYNDFYVELIKILPKKICFSNDNLNSDIRKSNLTKATLIIKDFLSKNTIYYTKLKDIYNFKNIDAIIKDIIAGYILYLTPHINKNTGADVYADKRSVCYSKYTILDLNIL